VLSILENKYVIIISAEHEKLEEIRGAFSKWRSKAIGFWSLKSSLRSISSHLPDLVLLNLDVDDDCPWSFLEEISHKVPSIVLSGSGSSAEALMALERGAADYVRLPAQIREILIRSARLVKRKLDSGEKSRVSFADLQINPIDRAIQCVNSGMSVPLSAPEFRAIMIFVKSPNTSIERDVFAKMIKPKVGDSGDRGVDVLISRLRSKLRLINSKVSIRSIRGSGYFLEK
jgi:DNA-binding response OmpR family regulator